MSPRGQIQQCSLGRREFDDATAERRAELRDGLVSATAGSFETRVGPPVANANSASGFGAF